MSDKEIIERMRAALKNILDISSDEFSRHQARWGLTGSKSLQEGMTHEIR